MNLEEIKQILLNTLEGKDIDKFNSFLEPQYLESQYENMINFYTNYPENSYALNHLGLLYQARSKDYQKIIELFEKSVQLGNSDAMNSLATMHYLGNLESLDRIGNLMKNNPDFILKILNKKDELINNQKEIITELMYFPGGIGYYECKSHFADCL